MNEVTIYTDGACSGNPGPGGYGVVIIKDGIRNELSSGYFLTTNNRMEIMAALSALESITDGSSVVLYSDSKYLVDTFNKRWIYNWQKKGWKRSNKETVKNIDLWEKMLTQINKKSIEFRWVKGHNGHPENERADVLAREATLNPEIADEGYDAPNNPLGI